MLALHRRHGATAAPHVRTLLASLPGCAAEGRRAVPKILPCRAVPCRASDADAFALWVEVHWLGCQARGLEGGSRKLYPVERA